MRSYSRSAASASMKVSVAATEILKLVIPPSSLHSMNSRTSGWSTRRIPMFAPRRAPPCLTASVAALTTRRNQTGPEAGAAPRLLGDGRPLHRLEDLLHRVPDREHVARRVLQRILLPRVHQRGRVGQEVAVDHPVVEGGGHFRDRGLAAPEAGLRGRDGEGHAPAHLLGGLAHFAVLAREVTLAKHTQGRLRPAPHPRWPRL